VNRGLLLGGALIIAFGIYFTYDILSFRKEAPLIQELIKEYLEDCAEINTGGGSVDAFIEKYFTTFSGRFNNRYGIRLPLKQELAAHLNKIRENPEQSVESVEFHLIDVTQIRKLATNVVNVTFRARTVAAGPSNAVFINLFQFDTVWFEPIPSDKTYSVTMIRTGGVWRFAEAYMWGGGAW
jgi:hypothetical protein